ncbi:MAG: caspase family protein [Bacteroidota bacterium]
MRFVLLLLTLATTAASAQTYSGRLAPGDVTLGSGEFRDEFSVEAGAGETVEAVVTSDDFDTYVILISPSGAQEENDDCTDGETTRSCATLVNDQAGTVRVLVTSYAVGETGAYALSISTASGPAPQRPSGGAADAEAGSLGPGDATLTSGEFFDRMPLRLGAGERIAIGLTSSDFDPYLILKSPDGTQEENDDCDGDVTRSCLEAVASEAGEWEILVTSYRPGETGAYALAVDRGGAAPSGSRVEAGALAPGDTPLTSGEFTDRYTVTGTGGPVVVDLTSTEFDPYLIVEAPGGEQFDNDDHEGSLTRSLLVVDTEAGASYDVVVTSYAVGETGRYRLSIQADGGGAASDGVRRERGTLASGDDRLDGGEYVDKFTFTGVPGQRLQADLTSDVFDTYLVVDPPRGEAIQDDDGGGRTGHSRVEMDLTEPGTYTVYVTSYAADETGAYELALDLSESFGRPAEPAAGERDIYSQRTSALTLAETLSGTLDGSDQRLQSGEFMEVHTFDGDAGEPVRIEMTSAEVDTYLIVESPSGERIENDDFEGDQTRSVVEFAMREAGRYRVIATTYRPGETGAYTVRVSQADALRPDPPAYDRIVGLFVGISDYTRMGPLRWTAQDAVEARDAMVRAGMAPGDGILLTDADATVANVRSAIDRLAASGNDRTLFVFFFSGHGGQYARTGFQREDPDGLDESLEMYDAEILDDELDALFARIPSSRQLIVLDACFSGGFAKDVISRPGRMGLFSSEEDVVSSVAVKFEAGGYLSRFFSDAIAGRQADEDANGGVTALELSHYLYGRFVGDIDANGRALLVARDTRPEHQKLVVDRGSVGLYDTLFLFGP